METKTEIIYLTIFLVLIIILTSGIVKDLKQLITKKDFNDNMQYYLRWTLPGVVFCIGRYSSFNKISNNINILNILIFNTVVLQLLSKICNKQFYLLFVSKQILQSNFT